MRKNAREATYLLDTNIILRFLLNDHPEYSKAAKEIFEKISTQGLIGFINHVSQKHWIITIPRIFQFGLLAALIVNRNL